MSRVALLLPVVLAGLVGAAPDDARAGGGPETVLVVANGRSPASLEIANHYVTLREIPPTHICVIDTVPNTGTITIDQFRDLIWAPIEAFLKEQKLEDAIDIIAYSTDFPFGVDYDPDFKGKQLPQGANKFRTASLTGVTYLYRYVKTRRDVYLNLLANRYCRFTGEGGPETVRELQEPRGFRNRHAWGMDAERSPARVGAASPHRYYLCTMLGFTGMQGNTVREIRSYLETGATCDGTRPKGTVYLMDHKDVRSRTRKSFFPRVAKLLKARGRKAQVLKQGENKQDGKLPVTKHDVVGAVVGIAGFNWQASGSDFLQGAIAEHLTSFGARFDGSGQTKCSEFLRAGAVGTSGAVAEPYALWNKFPLPYMHVDYADGCCMAEAFYGNVRGPYQLLVIGDPLARPYADFADVKIVAPSMKDPWSGTVKILTEVKPSRGKRIGALELWVDGRPVQEEVAGAALSLDTTKLEDGYHELRVVAVEAGPIETRSSTLAWVRIQNGARTVTIMGPRKGTALGAIAALSGKASKARTVELFHGNRRVAETKVRTGTWKVRLPTDVVGVGRVELRARASYGKGGAAVSAPFLLQVDPPVKAKSKKKRRPRKPKKGAKPKKGKAGLKATVLDARGKEHTFAATTIGRILKKRWLTRLKQFVRAAPSRIGLTGEFQVTEKGTYQLALNASGSLRIKVRGAVVFDEDNLSMDRQAYVALPLDAGWHKIEIEYKPTSNGNLSLILGGAQVAMPLTGNAIRH